MNVEGSLSGIQIKTKGRKYAKAPEVVIEQGGGAKAVAQIDDRGRLTSINLIEPGSGYNVDEAPLVLLKGKRKKS